VNENSSAGRQKPTSPGRRTLITPAQLHIHDTIRRCLCWLCTVHRSVLIPLRKWWFSVTTGRAFPFDPRSRISMTPLRGPGIWKATRNHKRRHTQSLGPAELQLLNDRNSAKSDVGRARRAPSDSGQLRDVTLELMSPASSGSTALAPHAGEERLLTRHARRSARNRSGVRKGEPLLVLRHERCGSQR